MTLSLVRILQYPTMDLFGEVIRYQTSPLIGKGTFNVEPQGGDHLVARRSFGTFSMLLLVVPSASSFGGYWSQFPDVVPPLRVG